jgi:hypothetical protein
VETMNSSCLTLIWLPSISGVKRMKFSNLAGRRHLGVTTPFNA